MKLFYVEVKFTLVELSRTRQHPGKNLDAYIQRFHKKAVGCYNAVVEELLVDVCLLGVMEENRIFLEFVFFLSFRG